jgi:hypothetical protein
MTDTETSHTSETPVTIKEIYDLYRTSLLNSKYYAYQVQRLTKLNLIFEIVIAVGTAGSGVAGIAFLQAKGAEWIWGSITACAALLATIKPVLNLGSKIQKNTELWSGYQTNYISLKRLVGDIRRSQRVSRDARDRYIMNYDRHEKLAAMDVIAPSRKLLIQFQAEVMQELPTHSFWWPKRKSSLTVAIPIDDKSITTISRVVRPDSG